MTQSHRIREIIILSPTTLAGAITNPAILKSEQQIRLLRSLPNTFVTTEELTVALKNIFVKAIESAGGNPGGPIAFIPDDVRRLVRRYEVGPVLMLEQVFVAMRIVCEHACRLRGETMGGDSVEVGATTCDCGINAIDVGPTKSIEI